MCYFERHKCHINLFSQLGIKHYFPKCHCVVLIKKIELGAFILPVFPRASLIPLISFASSCQASLTLWWACLPVYNTWRYSFIFLFLPLLPKVRVLWTRLSGGELPWNLDRQSPVWSHLLRRGGAEGPRKLHENAPEDWGHSGDAYRGSGKACSRGHKWYRVSKSGLFLKMLTRQRGKTGKKWFWPAGLVMQRSHELWKHSCTWVWKEVQRAQTGLYKWMFYLTRRLHVCVCEWARTDCKASKRALRIFWNVVQEMVGRQEVGVSRSRLRQFEGF